MSKKIYSLSGAVCLLIALVFVLGSQEEAKRELNQNGIPDQASSTNKLKGNIRAELEVFNFDEAVTRADLIAKVQIERAIKEIDEPSPKTLYQASVLELLKGDEGLVNRTIDILQQGNSTWSFNNNTMFGQGDEYFLFLNKATVSNTYWILGEETGMYEVIDDGRIEKKSLYLDELTDIEDKVSTEMFKKNQKEVKDIQILYENKFMNKIVEQLNKNRSE
ncbi:hypothetical protein [Paenibacillus sp. PAMC21692]|uniref:hypothetical protein n=1 Tax=Paenibacillus sp. PAMC21692 TaxID=2762320 RepID=UPI00164EA632|nr:hypothetical protein [Paenibacillus sp. PAMC21692]QNK57710.1 hypothetical protein H7F31_01705 [Paenibacillus sp. PAMC21692]